MAEKPNNPFAPTIGVPDPPGPVPLNYGSSDLPSDLQRQADAVAEDFGGRSQALQAFGWAAVGAIAMLALFHGITEARLCSVAFGGVMGLTLGFFAPVADKDAYARVGAGIVGGLVLGAVGSMLCFPSGGRVFSVTGFWVGYHWMGSNQEKRDGLR